MKISKTLLHCLQQLAEGNSIAASTLRKDIAEQLLAEGLLTVRAQGSRRTYSAIDASALQSFLSSHYEELRDWALAMMLVENNGISRSEMAASSGNSKLVPVRTCPGFWVNSYEAIACMLNGQDFVINPPTGSFIFIADWQSFAIPRDVVVVGIENMENFRKIRRQKSLFDKYLGDGERKILFVSRYPQSADLRSWLKSIPNNYVHYGDFDLAGIHIFLTEYHEHLGSRSSYLIPDDIESRIAHGSVRRYNDQYLKYHQVKTGIPQLQALVDLIHRHRRCYDQEGYIV